jgi:hypothetical protein
MLNIISIFIPASEPPREPVQKYKIMTECVDVRTGVKGHIKRSESREGGALPAMTAWASRSLVSLFSLAVMSCLSSLFSLLSVAFLSSSVYPVISAFRVAISCSGVLIFLVTAVGYAYMSSFELIKCVLSI